VLFLIEVGDCRIHLAGCTYCPTGAWVVQQARSLAWNLQAGELRPGSCWDCDSTLPYAHLLKSLVVTPAPAVPVLDNDEISEIVALNESQVVVRTASGSLIVMDLEGDHAGARAHAGLGRDAVDLMVTSPNGRWLATGGQDLSVRRLPELSLVATPRHEPPGQVARLVTRQQQHRRRGRRSLLPALREPTGLTGKSMPLRSPRSTDALVPIALPDRRASGTRLDSPPSDRDCQTDWTCLARSTVVRGGYGR
jgi:hypothetical protein